MHKSDNNWKEKLKSIWNYKENSGDHRKRYKRIHKHLKRKIKSLIKKRKLYVKWLNRKELIDAYVSDKQKFWRNLKIKRSSCVDVDISLSELKRSYEENFNKITQSQESKDKEEKMANVVNKYTNAIIKKSKKVKVNSQNFKKILSNLKNNKAPGFSTTTNEMFKYSLDTMVPSIISKIFENMLNNYYCTGEINVGVITTIIKDNKASCQDIGNTRPITLSDPLSNILEMLILENITKKGSLHQYLYGFRPNNSCMHAVFHLNEIALDVKEKK